MKTDKNEIIDEITDNADVGRKTIGVDISLEEIVTHTLQAFADLETEKIQNHIQQHGSTGYTVMGKLDLLKEVDEEL